MKTLLALVILSCASSSFAIDGKVLKGSSGKWCHYGIGGGLSVRCGAEFNGGIVVCGDVGGACTVPNYGMGQVSSSEKKEIIKK